MAPTEGGNNAKGGQTRNKNTIRPTIPADTSTTAALTQPPNLAKNGDAGSGG